MLLLEPQPQPFLLFLPKILQIPHILIKYLRDFIVRQEIPVSQHDMSEFVGLCDKILFFRFWLKLLLPKSGISRLLVAKRQEMGYNNKKKKEEIL